VDATISNAVLSALDHDQTVVLATVVAGPGLGRQLLLDANGTPLAGDLGGFNLNAQAQVHASALLPAFGCGKAVAATTDGPVTLFVETLGPRPQLVVVGAVHVAVPLVHVARLLGFRTVVIDPRPVFASPARFAHADVLLAEWPDEAFTKVALHDRTAIAVLSHDLKIDVPALAAALKRRLVYVGALGSKKTQAKRRAALLEAGIGEDEIARVRSPIGLDLGGRRAEEVAIAIMAEIVAVTNGAAVGRTVSA
jgi:xanthine dehydrogenase accessory factor